MWCFAVSSTVEWRMIVFRHGDVTLKALDARHSSTMTWHGGHAA
jgi:hypothetical protein